MPDAPKTIWVNASATFLVIPPMGRHTTDVEYTRNNTVTAAITRAYQMGLDAGRGELLPVLEGLVGPDWGDAWYGEEEHDKPRALTPPADLVGRTLEEKT
jgi:hypothetical protein